MSKDTLLITWDNDEAHERCVVLCLATWFRYMENVNRFAFATHNFRAATKIFSSTRHAQNSNATESIDYTVSISLVYECCMGRICRKLEAGKIVKILLHHLEMVWERDFVYTWALSRQLEASSSYWDIRWRARSSSPASYKTWKGEQSTGDKHLFVVEEFLEFLFSWIWFTLTWDERAEYTNLTPARNDEKTSRKHTLNQEPRAFMWNNSVRSLRLLRQKNVQTIDLMRAQHRIQATRSSLKESSRIYNAIISHEKFMF